MMTHAPTHLLMMIVVKGRAGALELGAFLRPARLTSLPGRVHFLPWAI